MRNAIFAIIVVVVLVASGVPGQNRAYAQDVLVVPQNNGSEALVVGGGDVLVLPKLAPNAPVTAAATAVPGAILAPKIHEDHVEYRQRGMPDTFSSPAADPAPKLSSNIARKGEIVQLLTEVPKSTKLDARQLPALSPNRDVMGLHTPLIAVGPTTKEEDADLDAAIAQYQSLRNQHVPYPDSHKPFADFLQKYPTSAWADSIRTNLGLAAGRQK